MTENKTNEATPFRAYTLSLTLHFNSLETKQDFERTLHSTIDAWFAEHPEAAAYLATLNKPGGWHRD